MDFVPFEGPYIFRSLCGLMRSTNCTVVLVERRATLLPNDVAFGCACSGVMSPLGP